MGGLVCCDWGGEGMGGVWKIHIGFGGCYQDDDHDGAVRGVPDWSTIPLFTFYILFSYHIYALQVIT